MHLNETARLGYHGATFGFGPGNLGIHFDISAPGYPRQGPLID
jgi:hypothetical protein